MTPEQAKDIALAKEHYKKALAIERQVFKSMKNPDKVYITEEMLQDIQECIYISTITEEVEDENLKGIIADVMDYYGHNYDTYEESKDYKLLPKASKRIMDNLKEHPVQKRLTRSKVLSRRLAHTSKTPNQHVNYIWGVSKRYTNDKIDKRRMDDIEKRQDNYEARLSALESMIEDTRDDLKELLNEYKRGSKMRKKIEAYLMKEKGVSMSGIGEVLEIDKSTASRYCKDIEKIITTPE